MPATPTRAAVRWTVVLTGVGSLMAALDTLVVSTSLTAIRADLHASTQELEWTVNSYNLAFAMSLVTGAAIGDRFGRRRWFAAGLALFAAASAACAAAPDVQALIAARAVQGLGAALLMPIGLALLAQAFPPERRGAAIGIFSAITGLAVASGPLVGGAVVHGLSWHWIFWLNVPIGVVAAVLAGRAIPESFGRRDPLDVRGLVLLSAAVLALLWALVRADVRGWTSAEVIGSLVASAVLTALFVAQERRAVAPMLPTTMFANRAFTAGNLAILLTFAALFTGVFFFAQLLQVVLHSDALGAGLRLTPWTATFLTVAPAAGALADRVRERWLLGAGLALTAIGYLWLAAVTSSRVDYHDLVGPFVLAGIGVSMAIPCAQNAVVNAVGAADVGKAAGVNSMMRELGGVLGIAVSVAVFVAHGDNDGVQPFVAGFRPALVVAAGFAVIGSAVALVLPSRRPVVSAPMVPVLP